MPCLINIDCRCFLNSTFFLHLLYPIFITALSSSSCIYTISLQSTFHQVLHLRRHLFSHCSQLVSRTSRRCHHVLRTTAAALHPTPMTCSQRPIAPEARHNQWQQSQRRPLLAWILVRRLTLARMPVITIGIWQAVVEHPSGTAGTSHPLDALLDAIGCILAAATMVAVGVKHLVAVDALETGKRLLTKKLPIDWLSL